MRRHVYGYIFYGKTGVMTSWPNSWIELTDVKHDSVCYIHSSKVEEKVVYQIDGKAGVVFCNPYSDVYTIWYAQPNPIEAKEAFFEYIYGEVIAKEKELNNELAKLQEKKEEIMEKFGIK